MTTLGGRPGQRKDQRERHADDAPRTIRFSELAGFSPKQKVAYETSQRKRYTLYGGARGGGKSRLARWRALGFLLQHARTHPGLEVGVFCESYRILRDRMIKPMLREFPKSLGTYNDQNHEFRLDSAYGSGVIAFRNLDDTNNYLGVELAGIFVDQLEQSPPQVFLDLVGSLRWPGLEFLPFFGTANPGGIGHLWVKQLWIDRRYEGDFKDFAEFADDFAFVKALPTDNSHLSQQYWTYLRSQPPRRQRAWIHGEWDVFEGQVYSEWQDAVHVIPHRTKGPGWRLFAGCDWGIKDQGVVAIVGTDGRRLEAVGEHLFRETDARQVGYECGLMMREKQVVPEWIACDAQMGEDGGTGGPTILEAFQYGLRDALGNQAPSCFKAPKGRGSRAARQSLLHELLRVPADEKGTPYVGALPQLRFVREGTPYLIRTIPALPYDDKNADDVDTNAEDHGYDALTYCLMARLPKRPEERMGPGANIHPGFGPDGRRRRPLDDDEADEQGAQDAVVAAHKRMADGEDPGYANPYLGFHQGSPLREVGDDP